jgi:hypothetical protein
MSCFSKDLLSLKHVVRKNLRQWRYILDDLNQKDDYFTSVDQRSSYVLQ